MPTQRPPSDEEEDLFVEQDDDGPLEHEERPEPARDEPTDDGLPEPPDEGDDEGPVDEPIKRERKKKLSKEEADRSRRAAERRIRERRERYAADAALRQEAAQAKAEAAQARAELEALRNSSVESTLSRVDEQISQAERELAAAIEAGQTQDQVKANRALQRLEAERYGLASKLPPKRDVQLPQQHYQPPQQQSRPSFDGVSTEALAWSARHGDISTWQPMEQEILWRVAEDIRDEGEVETDSPQFLKELENRLAARLPHRINSTAPKRGAAYDLRRPRAQPSPAVNGEGGAAPTSGPRRQLQSAERSLLRQMYQGEPTKDQIQAYMKANPTAPNLNRERVR